MFLFYGHDLFLRHGLPRTHQSSYIGIDSLFHKIVVSNACDIQINELKFVSCVPGKLFRKTFEMFG